jgi:hypothetical protein
MHPQRLEPAHGSACKLSSTPFDPRSRFESREDSSFEGSVVGTLVLQNRTRDIRQRLAPPSRFPHAL